MPETDSGECPAPNPISRPGRDRAMSYPLDNPRKEDPPVPVGPYYFETLNKVVQTEGLFLFLIFF